MSEQSTEPEPTEPFRHEVFFYMDSDFCEECGCLLSYGESGLCADCLEDLLSEDEDEDDWFWWEEDMHDENQSIVRKPTTECAAESH